MNPLDSTPVMDALVQVYIDGPGSGIATAAGWFDQTDEEARTLAREAIGRIRRDPIAMAEVRSEISGRLSGDAGTERTIEVFG